MPALVVCFAQGLQTAELLFSPFFSMYELTSLTTEQEQRKEGTHTPYCSHAISCRRGSHREEEEKQKEEEEEIIRCRFLGPSTVARQPQQDGDRGFWHPGTFIEVRYDG